MASSARAFVAIRLLQPPHPPFSHRHLFVQPLLPSAVRQRLVPAVNCLFSGVDDGGVSEDFVSTRKSGFTREFSVIASMLKRIEPLDTSVISQGISDSAKDSMKETISAMLGLLPSDQFSVIVRVSKSPLERLLVSSILAGYTLWNAEDRISLMRNFQMPSDLEVKSEIDAELEKISAKSIETLSPEVMNYIHWLENVFEVLGITYGE